jgi:PAS domain S-box-containing protein
MSTELSITEIRFNELAESAPVGIFLTDASGAAVYANPALSQITGIAEREFLGPGWQAVIDATVAKAGESGDQAGRDLAASARRVGHGESKSRIGRPDGSSCWVDIRLREVRGHDGLPTGYIGIIGDITEAIEAAERHQSEERRRAEEDAWRNAERLESLRRMAGGVAHDFNNLHASVLGYAQLADEAIAEAQAALRMPADLGRQLREELRNLTAAARKASGLTMELLRYGGRVNFTPVSAEVAVVIRGQCDQLAQRLPEHIELDVRLDPQLPPVNADADRIAEILDSLVINAIDALPDGGTISVTATTVTVALEAHFDAGASGSSPGELTAGEYVLITVADTGEGMTPQTLAHAIDPFFTTRPRPHAGLGLAATFGALRQIGGDLVLASESGRGTAAQAYLPITGTPVAAAAEPALAADGGQTVLVVTDEPGIRDISARILRRSGWTVLSAASGPEALRLAAGYQGKIDCLLTDIVMPGMLGSELARQFAGQRPETRVIYMSGYAVPMLDEDSPATHATMLGKPFAPADLLAALRQAGPAD